MHAIRNISTINLVKYILFSFIFAVLAFPMFAGAAYRDTVQSESNILHYWPMDVAVGATSTTALVGGISLNLSSTTPGISGQVDGTAISFTSASSSFAVSASNINLSSYNKIVIEALVNFPSHPSGNHLAWEHSVGGGLATGDFYFDIGNSVLSPALAGNAGYSSATFTPHTTSTWHHLVVEYDKTLSTNEVNIYINGILKTSLSRPFNSNNTDNFVSRPFYLMSRGGASLFATGSMQHLAIYSDLSTARIRTHTLESGLATSVTAGVLTEQLHTTSSVTLSWTAGSNGFSPITTQLQRSLHNANSWSNVSAGTSSPVTDTGLSANTTYDYRVAYTDAALVTVYSSTVSVTTLPVVSYPSYPANSDIVIMQPYDTAQSGSANWGMSGAQTALEFIGIGHKYRMRQDGTITKIRLYTVNKTALSRAYIKVWRKNGTTYDLVGTSNNIVSDLVAGSSTLVTLSSPITGVQEGDYVGMRIESDTTGVANFFVYNPGSVTSYYTTETLGTTGVNWESKSASSNIMPIETYMQAPQAVFIGDSIISGNSSHQSFLNTTETTNVASTIERKFSIATGYTYQNMGIGGQGIAAIASRFTADVINLHPRVVVIEGGVNDIQGGATSKSTFLANWTTMLDAAQADSGVTKILVLKILPWSNGTNTQMQTRDDWNNSLATLAAGYSKAVVVDASTYVGQNRVGGDSGNLWDIIPYHTDDGVHFTSSGHFQIAQALADSIALTTAATVDGSYTLGRGSTPPTIPRGGFAVSINGGSPITTDRVVNLEFKTDSDIANFVVSMDKDFSDTAIKNYSFGRKISFDLCSKFGGILQNPVCPDGKYSVFAKFYTASGAVSETVSSTVTLITTPSSASSTTSVVKNTTLLTPSERVTSSNPSHTSSTPSLSGMLSRGLKFGMRGEDVRILQRALATIPNVYPENLVTGYFGRMTEKAIQRFQLKFGIVKSEKDVSFGYVGPKTRLRLREMFP